MKDEHHIENNHKCNHLRQVKYSKQQNERLEMLAQQMGFGTVSSYVKFMTLNPDLRAMLSDMHRVLKIIATKVGVEYEEKNAQKKV